MPKNIVVPKLGPSIDEGLLVAWLVKEGAFVKRGAPLFAVETDKSIVDCESTDDGYLGHILVQEGATVRVDQVLAVLTDQRAAPGCTAPPDSSAESSAESSVSRMSESIGAVEVASITGERTAPATDGRVRISPRARQLARETGIGIEQLAGSGAGSGPGGRIVRRDVESFIGASVGGPTAMRSLVSGAVRTGRTRDVPLSGMRRAIVRRLTEAAQIPVFFTTVKIDADALIALRQQLERARDRRVSVNDIIVKACAIALAKFPQINATFHGEHIRLHEDIDISIAVAIEDGLIAPIVYGADTKSLMAISAEIKALGERARAGGLAPEDYQGGTFTVSNLGMYGVEAFTAIINPPQCAILAVGAIERELRLHAGVVKEAGVFRVTLSADHRVADGALAGRFLSELKMLLENPACVLL